MPQPKTIALARPAESRGGKRNVFRGASGLLTACALILSSGFHSKALADVTDELLEIMKKKGDLTEAQYKDLKTRHEAEKAAYQKTEKAAQKKAAPDNGAVPVALKKGTGYTDPPPPPPGAKDGALGSYSARPISTSARSTARSATPTSAPSNSAATLASLPRMRSYSMRPSSAPARRKAISRRATRHWAASVSAISTRTSCRKSRGCRRSGTASP
jgi:hypothetical protein